MKIPNTENPDEINSHPDNVNADDSGSDPDDGQNGGNSSNGNHSNHGNHTNSETQSLRVHHHEEAMFGAIDKFCNTSEQTYEEFLQCFSHFKPGATSPQLPSAVGIAPTVFTAPSSTLGVLSGTQAFVSFLDQVHQTTGDTQESSPPEVHGLSPDSDELLDEETLGVVSIIPQSEEGALTKPMVKMDNFVDDEAVDEDEDEMFVPSGYCASFGASQQDDPEISARRNTTDPEEAGVNIDPPLLDQTAPDAESQEISIKERSQDVATNLEVTFDSAGEPIVVCPGPTIDDPECESDSDDLQYDPGQDLPNPGEILEDELTDNDNQPSIDDIINIRQMEYSAKMGEIPEVEPNVINENCECTENESDTGCPVLDEVVPFSLDDDFDYDNVVLTPKYSAADLKLMEMLRKQSEL